MASPRELLALAERMGLEEAELKAWYDKQEAPAREEWAAEREAKKQKTELEDKTLQLRLKVAEAEGSRVVASQQQLEVEERMLQFRLRMAETDVARETRT